MFCCFTVNSFLNMSLPTAGMVIGYVCTVINLFQSGLLIKADEIIEFVRSRADSMPKFMFGFGSSIGMSILVTLSLLDLIASVMLIIGVNKNKHLFLIPWLINNGVFLAIKLFFGIGLSSVALRGGTDSPGPLVALIIISMLVFLSMVWNAIYSLFQKIRKENEQEIFDTERLVGNPRSSSYELFKNPE